MDEPSKRAEYFHLARAIFWPVSLPAIILLDLQDSVFLVLILSLYANMASDISAYQGAKAEKEAKRNNANSE